MSKQLKILRDKVRAPRNRLSHLTFDYWGKFRLEPDRGRIRLLQLSHTSQSSNPTYG